jgi:heterogeneous nuclear ribonucleoprotein A1/A3
MKRFFLGIAAVALLLVATETASARPWYGVNAGYGYGGPYYGVSYGTRVGNNGVVSVGYSSGYSGYGYGYPAYGYTYAAPAYYSTPVYADATYAAPAYYSTPVYYTAPAYYSGPSFGVSYYSGGGWGRRWR